jgi:uncharacterized membrane protein YccC
MAAPWLHPWQVLRRRAEHESLRPDLGRAIRCTLALMGPLLFAVTGHFPLDATLAALAAQNVALPDVRGAYAVRFNLLLAFAVILALCGGLGGILSPHLALAVAGMALVAAAGGLWRHLSTDYGPNLAVSATLMYAIGLAGAGGPVVARDHFLAALAGGAWGLALQVAIWPFRPQHPLRRAVSDSWLAVADLFSAMTPDPAAPGSDRHPRMAEAENTLRTVLDQTYASLAPTGAGPPAGWLGQLEALHRAAARLALQVSALDTALEGLAPDDWARFAPAWQVALSTLTNTARTVALAVVSRQPGHLAACDVRLRRLGHLLPALQSRLPAATAAAVADLLRQIEAHLRVVGQDLRATIDRAGERTAISLELFDLTALSMRPLASALNLSPRIDPALVRYSVRIAVLTMLGVLAYKGWHLHHGYWLPFTMVVVLQPDYGATRQKAAQRMLGTVAGSILASLILWLHLPFAGLMAATAAASFVFCYFLKRNYGLAVVFITLFVVWLTEASGTVELAFTLERVASTLAGGLLALLAALVFWPMWERDRFPPLLARALRANAEYLRVLVAHLAAGTGYDADTLRAKRGAEGANSVVFSSLLRMTGDPKNRQDLLEQAAVLANSNQRLTRGFNLVVLHLRPPAPAVGRELGAFAGHGAAALSQIARRVEGHGGGNEELLAARRAMEAAPLPDPARGPEGAGDRQRGWLGAQFSRAATELTGMLLAASAWPAAPAPP